MKKILLVLSMLGLAFSSAQACQPCGEIKILPTQNLTTYPNGSKTVEVLIYNPEYCYSNITDISVSDDANFDVNRSYGDVPCGDASTVSMRGYQYCTVGLTFKPTTDSGTFTTDIQVTDRDTGLHTATVDGKVVSYCDIRRALHKKKRGCAKAARNYLADLNLTRPVPSSHVYVENGTLVFNEYYEANEGLATIALDDTVDFLSRLTFDVNQSAGLFMPRLAGDNGSYYTNDLRKTNRYGFMFPAGKAMTELNFTTWSVGFTGVVSKLSLVQISDLNQSSAQNNATKCHTHRSCKDIVNHWKNKCHKHYKKVSHKACGIAKHVHSTHERCEGFIKNLKHNCHVNYKKVSHKACDRLKYEHNKHKKSCKHFTKKLKNNCHGRYKKVSHKSCDRD